MSDENKEKILPEEPEEAVKETESNLGDDWTWDAAVPETETDNITFEDLTLSAEKQVAAVEEKAEVAEETDTEASEDTAEAVNESEEEKEAEDIGGDDDDGCCIVCGKKRDPELSDLYCKECYEKFLRTDYGVGHILLAFVMVFAAVIGYFVCASTIPLVPNIFKAQDLVAEKRYEEAMDLCYEISDDADVVNSGINAVFSSIGKGNYTEKTWIDMGQKAAVLTLESYASAMTAMDQNFNAFVESSFTDISGNFDRDKLNGKKYEKIRKAYDFNKELIDFNTQYGSEFYQYFTYDDNSEVVVDRENAVKYIEKLSEKTQAEKCMKDYYRVSIEFYTKDSDEALFNNLDMLMEDAGEFSYMFLSPYMQTASDAKDYDRMIKAAKTGIEINVNDVYSYSCLVDAYLLKGDIASADQYCEELKKNSPDAVEYYALKAEIFRRQNKLADAVTICTKGLAIEDNPEIYRQQAIAYMLLENKTKAAEAAKQSYQIAIMNVNSGYEESLPIDVFNTTALITFLCNGEEDETYKEIQGICEEQGITLEEEVLSCIKGDIEFSNIFMEGDFDLA